jgi:hypothetical protein
MYECALFEAYLLVLKSDKYWSCGWVSLVLGNNDNY